MLHPARALGRRKGIERRRRGTFIVTIIADRTRIE
jgi:hypothetical protein